MKLLLLATVAVLAVPHVLAAEKRSVTKRIPKHGFATDYDLAQHVHLGSRGNFRAGETASTAKGNSRRRLRQTYDGLDIIGTIADVEVDSKGLMKGHVTGTLAYNIENDIDDTSACNRTQDELLARARRYLKYNHVISASDTTTPSVKSMEKQIFETEQGSTKLVYKLDFVLSVDPTPVRPFFLFDACDNNLDILVFFNKINNMTIPLANRRRQDQCDTTPTTTKSTTSATTSATTASPGGACSSPARGYGGNRKTRRTVYGLKQPLCLDTQVSGSTCRMVDPVAEVYDMKQTRIRPSTAVRFTCSEGYSDAINGAYGVANDAFYFGKSAGTVYPEWYNMNALAFTPLFYVHYRSEYENAFWDGSAMTFGDGKDSFYPLVSQDVIGHELAHGITERFSDLYYAEQSGGINEAFSDMSGELVELYSGQSFDWKTGADIFKGDGALRYFEDPTQDGRSIGHIDDYRSGMNVHYSSGVFNRAFYQLVEEQRVPLRKAYEMFLQANRVIWKETTDFQEGACGVMKAAYDLGYDVTKVSNAFAVVGIKLDSCDYTAFKQVAEPGETRRGVSVSSLRNPVFALELTPGDHAFIDAYSDAGGNVTVYLTSDSAGSNVVVSGPAPFIFEVTAETNYFKLSCSEDDDASFDVDVETY